MRLIVIIGCITILVALFTLSNATNIEAADTESIGLRDVDAGSETYEQQTDRTARQFGFGRHFGDPFYGGGFYRPPFYGAYYRPAFYGGYYRPPFYGGGFYGPPFYG